MTVVINLLFDKIGPWQYVCTVCQDVRSSRPISDISYTHKHKVRAGKSDFVIFHIVKQQMPGQACANAHARLAYVVIDQSSWSCVCVGLLVWVYLGTFFMYMYREKTIAPENLHAVRELYLSHTFVQAPMFRLMLH